MCRARRTCAVVRSPRQLGGRARSTDGPYKANLGPHAIYSGGALWDFLISRNLMPPLARPLLTGVRFRCDGGVHRTPPLEPDPAGRCVCAAGWRPSTRTSAPGSPTSSDERAAAFLSSLRGVYTFYHDPGELSAAFVWERTQRLLLTPRPPARFIVGGWTMLVDTLERARPLSSASRSSPASGSTRCRTRR